MLIVNLALCAAGLGNRRYVQWISETPFTYITGAFDISINHKAKLATLLAVVAVSAITSFYFFGRARWVPVYRKVAGQHTVTEVVTSVGPEARTRMAAYFSNAGLAYPPHEITMLALKDSASLEIWAGPDTNPIFVRRYRIEALSGVSGPKLREGDRQVPEGLYRIDGLNPNSSYYLSMKLNYPNSFDLKQAKADGRSQPGSNIFIHGKSVSIGCLAMGDVAIEELFVLVHDVGLGNVRVAIAPSDPRKGPLPVGNNPAWVTKLYRSLENEFRKYVPPKV